MVAFLHVGELGLHDVQSLVLLLLFEIDFLGEVLGEVFIGVHIGKCNDFCGNQASYS